MTERFTLTVDEDEMEKWRIGAAMERLSISGYVGMAMKAQTKATNARRKQPDFVPLGKWAKMTEEERAAAAFAGVDTP